MNRWRAGRAPAPVEIAQQGQGDHVFAGARAVGDYDHLLVMGPPGLPDCGHHGRVGESLFTQQHELLPVPHFFGGNGHQLLGRPYLALEQGVGRLGTGPRCPQRAEVVDEGAPLFTGEHPAPTVFPDAPEPRHPELGRIVQICHAGDRLRCQFQRSVERNQVAAVAPHLLDRIQDGPRVRVDAASQRITVLR